MLFQRLHQYRIRHLQAFVKIHQLLVAIGASNFLGRDGVERAVEVVDALDEVRGETGDGEGFGGVDVAFGALLEVAEVGDGAEVFVLEGKGGE